MNTSKFILLLVANLFYVINGNSNNQSEVIISNLLNYVKQQHHQSQQRPCPLNCSCDYVALYCSDLIDTCDECVHWTHIDFSRISKLKYESFKYFKFARNKLTNIVINYLLNDTITQNSFKGFYVPPNSQIEITFHYPLIKFTEYSLNGIYLDQNSTLVFNFPFTTQVIFYKNCFQQIFMKDKNARFIIRIFKSFMVRFASEPSPWQHQLSPVTNKTLWNLSTGQFIIDIKLTRLIKFEHEFFSNINFHSSTKFIIDFELIEKLIFHENTFKNLNFFDRSQLVLFLKKINYLNIKEDTFQNVNLNKKSSIRVYLSDLTYSICFNKNFFHNINLNSNLTVINIAIINSKNIVFTEKSFTNINLNDADSKIVFQIYNQPSILFKRFDKLINYERSGYLLPAHESLKPNEIYFGDFGVDNKIDDLLDAAKYNQSIDEISELLSHDTEISLTEIDEHDNSDYDIDSNYRIQKQTYLNNISIERNTFFNLTNPNILFIVDNMDTLLIDNNILNSEKGHRLNLKLYLNIKNFISNKYSFFSINNVFIKFIKEPKVIKFDYEMLKLSHNNIKIDKPIDTESNVNSTSSSSGSLSDNEILKNNSTRILCDYIEWNSKTNILAIDKTLKYCTCENFNLAMSDLNNTKIRYFPCILIDNSINYCQIQFDLFCYNTLIINSNDSKKLIVKNRVEFSYTGQNFIKFWQVCSILKNLNSNQSSGGTLSSYDDEQFDLTTISKVYSFYHINDNESYIGDGLPSSLLNIPDVNSKEMSSSNAGKIIGIFIISLIIGIILFMIIINIIHYKLRGDQFDDFDTNNSSDGNTQPWSWKRTFSVQSLKRTLSLTSLKRSKREQNSKTTASLRVMENCNLKNNNDASCGDGGVGGYIFETSDDEGEDDEDVDVDFYEKNDKKVNNDVELEKLRMLEDKDSNENENNSKYNFSSENDSNNQRDTVSNETEIIRMQDKDYFEKEKLFSNNNDKRKVNDDLGYYSHD